MRRPSRLDIAVRPWIAWAGVAWFALTWLSLTVTLLLVLLTIALVVVQRRRGDVALEDDLDDLI